MVLQNLKIEQGLEIRSLDICKSLEVNIAIDTSEFFTDYIEILHGSSPDQKIMYLEALLYLYRMYNTKMEGN